MSVAQRNRLSKHEFDFRDFVLGSYPYNIVTELHDGWVLTFFKLCSQKLSNLDFSSSRICIVCGRKKKANKQLIKNTLCQKRSPKNNNYELLKILFEGPIYIVLCIPRGFDFVLFM